MAKLEVLDSGEVRTRLGASPIEWWTEDDGFGLLAVGVDGSLRAYAPSEAEAMLGGRLAHLTSYDGKLVIIIEPNRESPTKRSGVERVAEHAPSTSSDVPEAVDEAPVTPLPTKFVGVGGAAEMLKQGQPVAEEPEQEEGPRPLTITMTPEKLAELETLILVNIQEAKSLGNLPMNISQIQGMFPTYDDEHIEAALENLMESDRIWGNKETGNYRL